MERSGLIAAFFKMKTAEHAVDAEFLKRFKRIF
jgi:hypothetical protein